ncbi:hypothetical protein AK812_SmicGene44522 [Symbiodinium microadriaticum]|uniref:Uncharacterized protein n=1 Tax=Symbiodinium microadriaticum TaxID=2951 RepID=A0A1Q9BYB8_SYMMI|nr:hypothetical protein AK812_SmicGene44522 [Symbiodinium microadriaticum]
MVGKWKWSSLLDACPWLLLGLLITGALSAAAPPEGAAMGFVAEVQDMLRVHKISPDLENQVKLLQLA